ncbi:MAG: MarC family protein [Deltaproteobacteria bacterium]|jgi:multiple antibiotic resistance protein
MEQNLLSPAWTFFITSLISLFIIIDPLGNIFPFLALSAASASGAPRRLAGQACLYAFLILVLVVGVGRLILDFLSITLPAFQIAGGLILFRIAIDMLEGHGHFNRFDTSSSLDAADYRGVALVPLAVPLLSGPGAISTVLVLTSRSVNPWEDGLIVLSLVIIFSLTYLAFRCARFLLNYLKETSIRLVTRLMGLIMAALAVQFVLDGLLKAFPSLH